MEITQGGINTKSDARNIRIEDEWTDEQKSTGGNEGAESNDFEDDFGADVKSLGGVSLKCRHCKKQLSPFEKKVLENSCLQCAYEIGERIQYIKKIFTEKIKNDYNISEANIKDLPIAICQCGGIGNSFISFDFFTT